MIEAIGLLLVVLTLIAGAGAIGFEMGRRDEEP